MTMKILEILRALGWLSFLHFGKCVKVQVKGSNSYTNDENSQPWLYSDKTPAITEEEKTHVNPLKAVENNNTGAVINSEFANSPLKRTVRTRQMGDYNITATEHVSPVEIGSCSNAPTNSINETTLSFQEIIKSNFFDWKPMDDEIECSGINFLEFADRYKILYPLVTVCSKIDFFFECVIMMSISPLCILAFDSFF